MSGPPKRPSEWALPHLKGGNDGALTILAIVHLFSLFWEQLCKKSVRVLTDFIKVSLSFAVFFSYVSIPPLGNEKEHILHKYQHILIPSSFGHVPKVASLTRKA